jgi:plasmid stabilization system protein ParE
MVRVVLSVDARRDLDEIISSHHLPSDTPIRVRQRLAPLAMYPLIGPALGVTYRYLLGPWSWMLLVYRVDQPRGTVVVTAIKDVRRAGASMGDD